VVGIDVDLEMLSDEVSDIHIYDTGTASLQAADGTWVLNQTPAAIQNGAEAAESSAFVTRTEALRNGMTLYLCVPRTEIEQPKLDMLSKIILAIFVVVLLALALSAYAATKLVRPLKQLTIASQKMADGYLGVNIECNSRDEIGVLAANLKQMVQKLQDNIQYINRLAYHDVLTSTRNRAAYEEQITKLDEQIKVGDAAFGVVVMDINHTKQINDTYGHDVGDTMIAEAAKLIKKSFDTDSIYRIAGDKFVVVLTNTELLNYKELTVQFTKELDYFNEKAAGAPYDLVVAKGIAVFEKGRDLTFADVFRRADNMMCQNKKWIKNQQED
jgi:diguanylate cyclase (GGDEF)-like protein